MAMTPPDVQRGRGLPELFQNATGVSTAANALRFSLALQRNFLLPLPPLRGERVGVRGVAPANNPAPRPSPKRGGGKRQRNPPMPDPWYADGLNFTCTRCGHCCTGEPGFVWVSDDELAALAALRGEPLDEFTGLYTKEAHRGRTLREKGNGDCVFYDKATGCTVYEARPRQCRTWPF